MTTQKAHLALVDKAIHDNEVVRDVNFQLRNYWRRSAEDDWGDHGEGKEWVIENVYPKFQDAQAKLSKSEAMLKRYRPLQATMKAALAPWRRETRWPLPVFALGLAAPAAAWFTPAARRKRRRLRGACERCAYDLTANVSGVCPECGSKIAEAK